jgi:hypothetical protein
MKVIYYYYYYLLQFESKIDALIAEIDTYRKEINSLKK